MHCNKFLNLHKLCHYKFQVYIVSFSWFNKSLALRFSEFPIPNIKYERAGMGFAILPNYNNISFCEKIKIPKIRSC